MDLHRGLHGWIYEGLHGGSHGSIWVYIGLHGPMVYVEVYMGPHRFTQVSV